MRVVSCALFILCAAPSLASAQYGEPLRGDLRWGQAQRATGEEIVADSIVADSADALANRAGRLARELRDMQGASALSDRADRFAQTANDLARAVDSRVSPRRAAIGFDDLQRDYYELRSELFAAQRARSTTGRVVEEWADVASSFERLALGLGIDDAQLCRLEPSDRRYGARRYDDRYDDRYGARYDDRSYDPRLDRVP